MYETKTSLSKVKITQNNIDTFIFLSEVVLVSPCAIFSVSNSLKGASKKKVHTSAPLTNIIFCAKYILSGDEEAEEAVRSFT